MNKEVIKDQLNKINASINKMSCVHDFSLPLPCIKSYSITNWMEREFYYKLHSKGVINLADYWNSGDIRIDDDNVIYMITFDGNGVLCETCNIKNISKYTDQTKVYKTSGNDTGSGWYCDDPGHIYYQHDDGRVTYL